MSHERQKPRPHKPEQQALYWCPGYGEWLTLNELAYRKEQRRLTADTREREARSARPSEVRRARAGQPKPPPEPRIALSGLPSATEGHSVRDPLGDFQLLTALYEL
jgi:hypothetical protein